MAGVTLTADQQSELHQRIQARESIRSISLAMKIDRITVRKYMTENPATATPIDPIKDAAERRAHTRDLANEREQLMAVAGEKSFRFFLENLLREVVTAIEPPPRYKEPKATVSTVKESMLLQFSDWHAYEIVKPERVMNLNEYNAEIFGQRTWRVVHSAKSIVNKLRKGGWRFPSLTVGCNGDFISGTIHDVERHSDAPNVIKAAVGCGYLLSEALRDLSSCFERVEVFGTSGNHGRLPDHKRKSQKDPTRSWDYLIYSIARIALKDCKNIEFFLPDSYSVSYELEGYRFYQGHGDDIKSWNNIPFYGINRMATSLNALCVAAGCPLHYFMFGHFHNKASMEAPGSEYFVNGSLIGGTEFSVHGLGRSDKPCQWLMGVHRDYGVTHRWPLLGNGPAAKGSYDVRPWLEKGAA